MIHVKSSLRVQIQQPIPGMRIGSQNSSKAIVVEENKNKDERRFIARVFRNKADGKWYTSTDKRGLVVYLRKKPILGERIKIKSVSHNSATAEIVLVHKVKEC